jgi:hypothetical protein
MCLCNMRLSSSVLMLIKNSPLCALGESSWETSNVVGELAVVAQELNICTINQNLASLLLLHVLLAAERGEAPVLGDNDLLASWELVLGAAESLESDSTV